MRSFQGIELHYYYKCDSLCMYTHRSLDNGTSGDKITTHPVLGRVDALYDDQSHVSMVTEALSPDPSTLWCQSARDCR